MRVNPTIACVALFSLAAVVRPAHAGPTLFISDTSGDIGQVNLTTGAVVAGSVHSTGEALTDLAFNSAGLLYGTTFSGLYRISASTGAATSVGNYASDGSINALVGNGANLLGASSDTGTIYAVDARNAAMTSFARSPVASAGDLAYSGGVSYESGHSPSGGNELVNTSTGNVVGVFRVGSATGTELDDVYGLADSGSIMYAVAGEEIYKVNLATAILTPLFDYGLLENGQDLGDATGTAFVNEASGGSTVPEPASLGVLGAGLLGLGATTHRRRVTARVKSGHTAEC